MISFIWNNSESEQFINYLNSIHPTMKFAKCVSTSTTTYLDLNIYIKENQINTKTHFKSTNTFSYCHGKSNHLASFKGIYKGENIHILRNTTDEDTYNSTITFILNIVNIHHTYHPYHLSSLPKETVIWNPPPKTPLALPPL